MKRILFFFTLFSLTVSAQDYIKIDLRDTTNYFKYSDSKVEDGQKLIISEIIPICSSYIVYKDPLEWYHFDSLYNFMANNSHLGFKITFHNYSTIATPKINKRVSQLMAEAFKKKYSEDGFGNKYLISEGVGNSEHKFVYQNLNNDETIEREIKWHKITFGNNCEVEIIGVEETKFEFSDSIFIVGQEKKVEIRQVMRPHQLLVEQENQSIYDSVYQFLNFNKDVSISIVQHTDSRGSDPSNLKLSQIRANAMKSKLISKGISANRIKAIGKGESEPIHSEKFVNQFKKTDPNKFEQLHQINRRTIIRITHI